MCLVEGGLGRLPCQETWRDKARRGPEVPWSGGVVQDCRTAGGLVMLDFRDEQRSKGTGHQGAHATRQTRSRAPALVGATADRGGRQFGCPSNSAGTGQEGTGDVLYEVRPTCRPFFYLYHVHLVHSGESCAPPWQGSAAQCDAHRNLAIEAIYLGRLKFRCVGPDERRC